MTHHIANSHATRDTMLRSAPWLHADRITVIHNGIDTRAIESPPPALLPGTGVRVGLISRLERRKGVRDLLDAWPRVTSKTTDASLIIVGRGAMEPEVTERVRTLERAHFLGFRDDVPSVLNALDIVVVPSHWEGFGLIAAEAMAAGKPVIAADASSLPEIVRDGADGILVPPRDPSALAAAIVRLVARKDERERMGASGHTRVSEAFSVGRMVDEYDAELRRVAGATQSDSILDT